MNQPDAMVILALQIVAVMQMLLALVNFGLVRLMGWRSELARLSLLPREVFQVHVWFISLTLVLFAVLTWRFADVLARGVNELALWLGGGSGSSGRRGRWCRCTSTARRTGAVGPAGRSDTFCA